VNGNGNEPLGMGGNRTEKDISLLVSQDSIQLSCAAASVFLHAAVSKDLHPHFLLQVFMGRSGMVQRSGSVLISINEVNLSRARLVLGWVTVPDIYLGM